MDHSCPKETHKRCAACQQHQPLTSFSGAQLKKQGKRVCKACTVRTHPRPIAKMPPRSIPLADCLTEQEIVRTLPRLIVQVRRVSSDSEKFPVPGNMDLGYFTFVCSLYPTSAQHATARRRARQLKIASMRTSPTRITVSRDTERAHNNPDSAVCTHTHMLTRYLVLHLRCCTSSRPTAVHGSVADHESALLHLLLPTHDGMLCSNPSDAPRRRMRVARGAVCLRAIGWPTTRGRACALAHMHKALWYSMRLACSC